MDAENKTHAVGEMGHATVDEYTTRYSCIASKHHREHQCEQRKPQRERSISHDNRQPGDDAGHAADVTGDGGGRLSSGTHGAGRQGHGKGVHLPVAGAAAAADAAAGSGAAGRFVVASDAGGLGPAREAGV